MFLATCRLAMVEQKSFLWDYFRTSDKLTGFLYGISTIEIINKTTYDLKINLCFIYDHYDQYRGGLATPKVELQVMSLKCVYAGRNKHQTKRKSNILLLASKLAKRARSVVM